MSERPVILVGAGGHARVLIDALQCAEQSILFAVDSKSANHGTSLLGVPITGDESKLEGVSPSEVLLVNGLGSSDSCAPRRELFLRLKAAGWVFAQVIHPSAVIARSAKLGEGTQILAGAVVQPAATIGENTIINTRTSVDHDCVIGAHAHLAPGVAISGGAIIGEAVHVGVGSSIIQGVTIGGGSVIGAGSVVVKDVPAGVVAYGVPAKVVRTV